MAVDYARVLGALEVPFLPVGRGSQSAERFLQATSVEAVTGGVDRALGRYPVPHTAIVCTGVDMLYEVASALLAHGAMRLLVEKPAGANPREIEQLCQRVDGTPAEVYVAYNRRFYASVLRAREMIDDDGGVRSFSFEFTEWSERIGASGKDPRVLRHWFLANSTHVADMAFHLGGTPERIHCVVSGTGELPWHPAGSVFSGAGTTSGGSTFSYLSDWQAPGRWGVEVSTEKNRYVFRPLEKLKVQPRGSLELREVDLNTDVDTDFKPGLYKQVKAFLHHDNEQSLCTLGQMRTLLNVYQRMCPYGD